MGAEEEKNCYFIRFSNGVITGHIVFKSNDNSQSFIMSQQRCLLDTNKLKLDFTLLWALHTKYIFYYFRYICKSKISGYSYMIILFKLLRSCRLFPKQVYCFMSLPVSFQILNWLSSNFPISLLTLVIPIFNFFKLTAAIMVGMKQHVIVVLSCISLITKNVEHFVMILLAICIFFGNLSVHVSFPWFFLLGCLSFYCAV